MTTISVNAKNRTIELTKNFAAASARFGTVEYDQLQQVRKDYPNYKIVTNARKAARSDKPSYKGLTYEYMEKYIKVHDDEKKSIMAEYMKLRGMTSEADEALADSLGYPEMKAWFLETFSSVADFHEKRTELVVKAQQQKKAKKAEADRIRKEARRIALLSA